MPTTTEPDPSTTDELKAKAADAAGQAQEKVADATGQAQEKIAEATESAKEQAQQAGSQAKGRVRDQIDQRSTEFGERAGGAASDLRSVGDELRNQGKDQPAKLADDLADRAEQVAGYLKRSDADGLLGDVERFGRQRPWAVIAGGLAVGLVASRVLKSTSTERYRSAGSLPAPRSTTGGTASSLGATPRPTAQPAPPTAAVTPLPVGDLSGAAVTPSPLDELAEDAGRANGIRQPGLGVDDGAS